VMDDAPRAGTEGDFIAAILAGGKGKRLGMNKAMLEIDGCTVTDRIIDALRDIFPAFLLVVQDEGSLPASAFGHDVEVVQDLLPGKGPLGGIYTALELSTAPYVFVIACDMPYPSRRLVRRILSEAPGNDAVVPRRGDYIEPLFAVYRRDIRDRIRARLESHRLKIHDLIRELNVHYLDEEEIAASDPDFRSFFNINTPEDLRNASNG
jgi:molybdopterin-guanine dinucleotide biosynthesis protein A